MTQTHDLKRTAISEAIEEYFGGPCPEEYDPDCPTCCAWGEYANLISAINAASTMAKLLSEGECPWRYDTSQYREWYQDRQEAAKAFYEVSGGHNDTNT